MKVEVVKDWADVFSSYRFYVYKDGCLITSFNSQKEANDYIDATIETWIEIAPRETVWEKVF